MDNLNILASAFLVVTAGLLLLLPKRWAGVPLLIGTCYMTLGQGLELGPFSFSVIRLLIAAGLIRIMVRGERIAGGLNALDKLMLLWAAWALISSSFHSNPSEAFVLRLGLVYNACGIYFLLRTFYHTPDGVLSMCRVVAILLIPIAVEMFYEKITAHNLFSVLGGVAESPVLREAKIRAQGPFAHAILAGTIGAVSVPLIISLWQRQRRAAVAGILACLVIVGASASSGPILSTVAALGALLMWRFRDRMRLVRWFAAVGYIGLDLVMNAPAYYILARINVMGGSTGWHRARLIESASEHLSEWWLAGTDYTRHWMPTGVSWSAEHTDITNYYLKMGVMGGLPLMLLFIAVLVKAFSYVGDALRTDLPQTSRFMIWTLGAALFAHAVTFTAVSYFDQSFVFIYLTLAAIGSVRSSTVAAGSFQGMAAFTGFFYSQSNHAQVKFYLSHESKSAETS